MIDGKAIRAKFRSSPYTIRGWSRHNGINPGTMDQFLCGNILETSPMGQRIIAALRADDMLVELPDSEVAA